ncbi:Dimethyl-sulfide monooxygenase [Colletotrichum fructicola]|nr:Dimethyl-sulfide monooxygenase [Colletotrichum fructicola]
MFTPSHLCFGQWRRPDDTASDKFSDLSYWTSLAQTLERGEINALILADTYGQHDIYKGSAEPTIRTCCQYPMGDPAVPVTAMAAVTKNLGFIVTTSTSYEAPFVIAKRFSTLDHLTKGRFGWNIVTSFKESAAKAVGVPCVEHDERYAVADEYVELLYKIWEGSWSDDALKRDKSNEIYAEPDGIRWVKHHTSRFNVDAPHILHPSPQRTPFLLQAGTSSAGIAFAAKHAEAIMVSGLSPHILAPRVAAIREKAAEFGRDPRSVRIFAVVTPIIGRTDEEATAKYEEALKYASFEPGLAFFSGNAGIDLSKYDLDAEIKPDDAKIDGRVHSLVNSLKYRGDDIPIWTPRNIGKAMAIGGNGPVPVGGMREDLNFEGNQYNLLQTFFTCGYLVGQVPSQFLLTQELSKRISIFYSASYAASMFSGYLQAAIYKGLNGASGLPGWRWLFIFCGFISIWAPLWGFFAVPDNPFITKARWMRRGEQEKHIRRMEAPLNYFSVWLKSLDRFTVYQINLFPTAAQAVGLVTTLLYAWLSDGLEKRWQVLLIPAIINLIGMIMVAIGSSYALTFAGYLINAASWGFWPVLYAWAIEIMHKNMEERAVVIGIAQTLGQAFIAWVPVVILDFGKYAPSFHMGFSIMCGVSVLELSSIFLIKHFEQREKAKEERATSGV